MRQITLREPGRLVEERVPVPSPEAGEALVRVCSIGVCGTDLHAFAGRQPFFDYPRVLGHELGVEVVEVVDGGSGIEPGDRCAVEPYVSCGTCHACSIGKPNCCETLQVLGVHSDGGMRSFMAVPVGLLHRSERLSFDQLALVETLGIGAHAVRRSGLEAGQEALVVGAGPIGLAVIQFARAAGGNVKVLELSDSRRAFVERLGVETLPEPDDRLYEAVFDATGNPEAMKAAFSYVAHGGSLVFVGFGQFEVCFESPQFHRRELTLFASRNSHDQFPRIIRMIEEGQIDTAPWITHRMALAGVPAEFPDLAVQPGLVKAMIEVSDADA